MIENKRISVYKITVIMLVICSIFISILLVYNNRYFNGDRDSEDSVKFLIGVSQAELIEPWHIVMTKEIKEEASKYENVKVIYTDAAGSEEKQIADINNLIAYGIDILIISPTNSEQITEVVSEVYKSIPVIVLDRGVQGYDYTLYIGPDNDVVGRQVGKYVDEVLGESGGNVVEIMGASESDPTKERSEGFKSTINNIYNINLLEQINAGWNRDRAEDKMYDIYNTYSKIDLVFAHNDAMALGAYISYRNSQYKNHVKFIGIDGLPGERGGLDLVEKGIFDCTFICPTGGKEAIQFAMDILNKENGIPKKVILRSTKITKDNIEEYKLEQQKKLNLKEEEKTITLGFCNVGKEGGWRAANSISIKNAAKAEGIDLIYTEADLNQEKQIEIIRGFINMGVDVISFSPVVETGWEEVLKEAKEAGIPIILADRMIKIENDLLYTTFLGSDFREEGRRAARWVINNVYKGEPLKVLEIQGTIGSTPTIERNIGFQEIISKYELIEVVDKPSGGYTLKKGQKVMNEFLKSQKEIDVLFAHNDDMALGAIEAIENRNLKPGVDIKIVSIDAIKDAIIAIKDKKLNCSVECNPLLGPQLMKVVKDAVSGKDLPMKIITEETVFTQEEFNYEWLNRAY